MVPPLRGVLPSSAGGGSISLRLPSSVLILQRESSASCRQPLQEERGPAPLNFQQATGILLFT